MRVTVSFAQCRARGLPKASFSVQSGLMGMPTPDTYLAGSGPPGGVAWFAVLPARGGGVAALEPALRARVGRVVELRDAGPLFIAGAPRPGLIALGGDGHARALAFAALVVDATRCPEGLMLLGAWSANADTQATLSAVLGVPELRTLISEFTLVAPTLDDTPHAPQPLAHDVAAPFSDGAAPRAFSHDVATPFSGDAAPSAFSGFAPSVPNPVAHDVATPFSRDAAPSAFSGFAPSVPNPVAHDVATPFSGDAAPSAFSGFAPHAPQPLAHDVAAPFSDGAAPRAFSHDVATPFGGDAAPSAFSGFAPSVPNPVVHDVTLDRASSFSPSSVESPLTDRGAHGPSSHVADAWLELDGPGGQGRFPLVAAQVVLGRTGDVRVEDPRVSRRHALIERRLDGFVLEVLSTAHGVEVAGALRAHGTFPLVDGATFVMGDTHARFVTTPGRAPRSPFLRVEQLDAFFSGLGLPPPPIPAALVVVATNEAVSSNTPHGPQLAINWSPGRFSYRWASRTWSIALDSASFGEARPDARRVADTFRALGAVVADAMTHEGALAPPGLALRLEVVATSAAHALWRTPFGVEYLADDAQAALLEALTWRRTNRL